MTKNNQTRHKKINGLQTRLDKDVTWRQLKQLKVTKTANDSWRRTATTKGRLKTTHEV